MNYLRIKKNTDFQRLFKGGKRVFSPYLTLLYSPSPKMRMGVAVSKKHGKAVVRNTIKRRVRACFDLNSHLLDRNYSIIIIPKQDTDYSYHNFEKSICHCLKKINQGAKKDGAGPT